MWLVEFISTPQVRIRFTGVCSASRGQGCEMNVARVSGQHGGLIQQRFVALAGHPH
jgi:hypothetical protein